MDFLNESQRRAVVAKVVKTVDAKFADPNQKAVGVAKLRSEHEQEIVNSSKAHVCNVIHGKIQGLPKLTHFSLGRRKLVRREWLEQWMEANKTRC